MLAHKLHELRARRAAGETGFTLVELLVVVVIIVALAAIAVPIFLNQKGKADEAKLSSDATSAGKILASAVSQGEAVTLSNPANTISFAGQEITSEGLFEVVGYDANTGWAAADACVQVSTAGSATEDATNTAHYKIQGGGAAGPCPAVN